MLSLVSACAAGAADLFCWRAARSGSALECPEFCMTGSSPSTLKMASKDSEVILRIGTPYFFLIPPLNLAT